MDDDMQSALMAELGIEDPVDTTDETSVDTGSETTETEVETTEPEGAEPQDPVDTSVSSQSDLDTPALETPPTTDETTPSDPAIPSEPIEPKYATKTDVLEAMKEYDQSRAARLDAVNSFKQEILDKYHPGGIDRALRDSDGVEIRTAQDIVDRGLVKPNGEEYTYEEAAQWILDSTRRRDENYANVVSEAEGLAELNTTLIESSNRVMELYGNVLDALPNIKVQLADLYAKTLTIDPKTNIVIRATVDPVEFYTTYLAPYMELGKQASKVREYEAAEKQRQAELNRDERSGLPSRGTSKTKSNTGDEFVDAFIDELEGN